MPSINHEAPIELVRKHPLLAVELVRRLTRVPIPGDDAVEVKLGATDASNVIPAELTADITIVVDDKATGKPVLLVVVEPQGRQADEKKFAWPAYLANLRAAHRCESAVLIVACWDEAEAKKCRAAIPMGHPGYTLIPVVIGPHSTPDLGAADPWLTILAGTIGAIDLGTDSGRRMVLQAISATGSDATGIRTLSAIILGVASGGARLELEALMRTTPFRSEFIESFVDEGIKQGRAEGEAKAVVKVLKSRGIELTPDQQSLVTSCSDVAQLDTWLERAASATCADDVFKD
jgi:hypothetical protein